MLYQDLKTYVQPVHSLLFSVVSETSVVTYHVLKSQTIINRTPQTQRVLCPGFKQGGGVGGYVFCLIWPPIGRQIEIIQ